MASAVDPRRLGLGLVAVLLTALLVWFGTGLHPLWPLMWFAPLPVLLFATRASGWSAALTAAIAWLLGNLNMWGYYHGVLGLPPSILARIFATEALVFTLAVLLFRALAHRGRYWSALLAFPALWVSFEYLLNLASPHGTAGSLAYSQLNFLLLLQLASITGPWGMSFVLLLFASALAIGLHLYRPARKQALSILGTSAAVVAAVLLFGVLRLTLPPSGQPVKVGLVASDAQDNDNVADEGAPTAQLLQAYADQAAKLAADGAQVIVLPEKLGVTVDPDTRHVDALFQSLADSTKAEIVVGVIRVAPPLKYNEARIYTPSAPVQAYDKQHMLSPYESLFQPGTSLLTLRERSGTWGVAICKDMDFTPLSRQYGEAGAGLLLVPAWDFGIDRWAHGHMAVMRGVESGFAIVRSAKRGYLTVSDNRGRILSEVTSDSAPFATVLAAVPVTHDSTLYLLLGDWFAWLVLALLAFTLVRCFLLPGTALPESSARQQRLSGKGRSEENAIPFDRTA